MKVLRTVHQSLDESAPHANFEAILSYKAAFRISNKYESFFLTVLNCVQRHSIFVCLAFR